MFVRTLPTESGSATAARTTEKGPVWLGDGATNLLIKAASALCLLGIWWIASRFLPSSVMPSPAIVAGTLWTEIQGGAIWADVGISMTRIALSFTLALTIALMLGFAMGLSRSAERFFEIWVVCGISLPSLVTILTIFMVVGLNETAAVFAATVPIIPILTINVWGGIKAIDRKLIEMALAFHAGRARIIRQVIGPQVAPVILSSARFGLGLIWKMVLFVELLGRSNGIGYKIEFYYQMFNMAEVLAHALLFLFIMLFLEVVVLGWLEARLFRWRPAARH